MRIWDRSAILDSGSCIPRPSLGSKHRMRGGPPSFRGGHDDGRRARALIPIVPSRPLGQPDVESSSTQQAGTTQSRRGRADPIRLCLLFAVLLSSSSVSAACRSMGSEHHTLTVASPRVIWLEPYFRGLRTARVESPAGPLTMLVDTGGGATLVVPRVAERLGCVPVGEDVGHRMTGEVVVFTRCPAPKLETAGARMAIETLGVLDVNAFLPSELPRVDGVLALDAFRGSVVTLDWPARRIVVFADSAADSEMWQLRIATGTTGRFFSAFVRVDGGHGSLWFLLDSGNLRGTLVARHVFAQHLLDVRDGWALNVRVGPRSPERLRVEAADLIVDGVLGVDALLAGPVTLDLRGFVPPPDR